jgi:hypothetical protein
MSMGSHVGHFLLFSGIDLNIFLFVVFSNNQSTVYLSAWPDEERSKFFYLLENVRSCNSFTHADDCSFVIPPERTQIGFIFVENRLNQRSALSLI